MRLVLISDTHELTEDLEVPKGDILIHAGDATGRGTEKEVIKFNKWLGTLKGQFKKIIYVPGNHDFLFEKNPGLGKALMTNATVLIDEAIEFEGLKFYGSPWQPEFFNWAFNLPRGEALKKKWELIPEGTEVLITHGPPYGIGDTAPKSGHVGCSDLLDRVRVVKPLLHVFGHIHEGYGVSSSMNTIFANASICDGWYRPINDPIVVDL